MPKIIIEHPVDWSNGKLTVDGTWTGAQVHIDESDIPITYQEDGVQKGGFSGWVDLPLVERTKAETAEIYLWISLEKLIEIDDKDELKIMKLIDKEAKDAEKDLKHPPKD